MIIGMQKFKSTCAPDAPQELKAQPKPITVIELKEKLKSLGESTKGKKEDLIERLATATAKEATKEEVTVKVPLTEALDAAIAQGTVIMLFSYSIA